MDYQICPIITNGVHPYICPKEKCMWWTGTGCAIAELPGNISKVSDAVHELQDGFAAVASGLNGLV